MIGARLAGARLIGARLLTTRLLGVLFVRAALATPLVAEARLRPLFFATDLAGAFVAGLAADLVADLTATALVGALVVAALALLRSITPGRTPERSMTPVKATAALRSNPGRLPSVGFGFLWMKSIWICTFPCHGQKLTARMLGFFSNPYRRVRSHTPTCA